MSDQAFRDRHNAEAGRTEVCPRCMGKSEHCARCLGWGKLTPVDAACDHKWDSGRNVGRCLTEYTCTLCGKTEVWDSSD